MDLTDEAYLATLKDATDELTIRRSLDVREASWYDLIALGDFAVPAYQRNYSWESAETGDGMERDELWRTLEESFADLEHVPSYITDDDEGPADASVAGRYMGAVYISQSTDEQYDVVDGQQRLVTFQLLIGALLETISAVAVELDTTNSDGEYLALKQEIETCQEDLAAAYNEGLASLSLNEEDEAFFRMLAAQPTQTSMDMAVIDYLATRIQADDDIDGQTKPRAIEARTLVEYLNGSPTTTHRDLRSTSAHTDELHGLQENKLSVETIESLVQDELDGDIDAATDILDTYIRFFESHAKLLNCYLEAYGFVESIRRDYGEGRSDQEAYILINLAHFVLHAITVSVVEITSQSTDVGLEIFESINDRGKELNDVDKIRARIKYVLDDGADSDVMANWRQTLERFGGDKDTIKDMLTYYVGATDDAVDDVSEADNALMEVFSDHSEDYTARLGGREAAADLVQDIYDFSEYYYHICDNDMSDNSQLYLEDRSKLENEAVDTIDRIVSRLNDLGFTQWFVLGPRLCQQLDGVADDDIADGSRGDFLQTVFDAIEIIAMRQSVSGKSGAATEGVYTTGVQTLSQSDSDADGDRYDGSETVGEMAEALIDQTPNLFGSGLISNLIEQKAWHTYTSASISKELLTRTVNVERAEAKFKAPLSADDDNDLTIEHVLPTTPVSDDVTSKCVDDPDTHEWLRLFFKLDADGAESDAPTPRIAADVSEYIIGNGVLTTDQATYEQAARFVSELHTEGIDLSTEAFRAARDAIDDTSDGEVDNTIVKKALDFDSMDDLDAVRAALSTALSALDVDQYDTSISTAKVARLIEELNTRFIDDIANLLLLSYADNPVASNNLLSKKLDVIFDENYEDIVVNEFFHSDGGLTSASGEFSPDDLLAFDDDTDISEEIACQADRAWHYDAAFDRKAELIETIVTHLEFDVDPDHQRYGQDEFVFEGESLADKITAEVERDKERRLRRDNF